MTDAAVDRGAAPRVAVVHAAYDRTVPSGENVVVDEEVRALQAGGTEHLLLTTDPGELRRSRLYPAVTAVRVVTGRGPSPLAALRAFAPDVVHVHNTFPDIGTRWLDDVDVPVVHTLHNFRPMCMSGLLVRDGRACTRCVNASPLPGVLHGCYRGSRAASACVALGRGRRVADDTLLARADVLVCPSELVRRTYAAAGVEEEKLVVKPHFTTAPTSTTPPSDPAGDGYWLYAGQLVEAKGIARLVRSWPTGERLVVAGGGPLDRSLREAAGAGVSFVGVADRERLMQLMRGARGLLFPSLLNETFGMVYAEALSQGLPVVAFEGNTVAHAVRADGTGAVVGWDRPLHEQLVRARVAVAGLRDHCLAVHGRRYSLAAHQEGVRAVYDLALERRRAVRASTATGPRPVPAAAGSST